MVIKGKGEANKRKREDIRLLVERRRGRERKGREGGGGQICKLVS